MAGSELVEEITALLAEPVGVASYSAVLRAEPASPVLRWERLAAQVDGCALAWSGQKALGVRRENTASAAQARIPEIYGDMYREIGKGKYGQDFAFLVRFTQAQEIPLPLPHTYPGLNLPLLEVTNAKDVGTHTHPSVQRILLETFGESIETEPTTCEAAVMADVAAEIIVAALESPADVLLQLYARVLFTGPAAQERVFVTTRCARIDAHVPPWYAIDRPFTHFLRLCAELLAHTDWSAQPTLLLSSELKRLHDRL